MFTLILGESLSWWFGAVKSFPNWDITRVRASPELGGVWKVLVMHYFYGKGKQIRGECKDVCLVYFLYKLKLKKHYGLKRLAYLGPLKFKFWFCTGPHIRLNSCSTPLLRLTRVTLKIHLNLGHLNSSFLMWCDMVVLGVWTRLYLVEHLKLL